MIQFAVVNPESLEIKGLKYAEDRSELKAGEMLYHEINPPIKGCPDRPFEEAIWKWGANGPYWFDPRSDTIKAAQVRAIRNQLLIEGDSETLKALRTGQPIPKAHAIRQQALCDVPQQPGFPHNVIWP